MLDTALLSGAGEFKEGWVKAHGPGLVVLNVDSRGTVLVGVFQGKDAHWVMGGGR